MYDKDGFVIVKDIIFQYYGEESDVKIPDTVTIIGREAFTDNTNLINIHIPDSVVEIRDRRR